jgi:serine/threonine protein kinase
VHRGTASFGIAALALEPKLTRSGFVMGTFAYMSPEQAEGAPAGSATDVRALGGVLAFAATGLPPFGGAPPRTLGGVPDAGLRDLITACFAESPAARPALDDILGALSGHGALPVRPPGEYEPIPGDARVPVTTRALCRCASVTIVLR